MGKLNLPADLVESMDVVRLVGNKAIHGGEIQLHEDPEILGLLFELVNQLAYHLMTRPRRIGEARGKLGKA